MMDPVPDRYVPPTLPAHRPSRRNDIIDAAIRQFARKGYVDASISDVAEEADVVVTAVYYHFSGKEELLSAAVDHVFKSISDVVTTARGDDELADAESLGRVIDAVWSWIDNHPDEATLFYLQLPGATRQITALRQEFEEDHAQRAFGYFQHNGRSRPSASRRAIETLTARTLVDLLISVQTMRLADGPLSTEANDKLRAAVHTVAARLVSA
jgi:AcrR family transcriptional regulator